MSGFFIFVFMATTALAMERPRFDVDFTPGCGDTIHGTMSDYCNDARRAFKRRQTEDIRSGRKQPNRILKDPPVLTMLLQKLPGTPKSADWMRQAMIMANQSDTINMTREYCSARYESEYAYFEERKLSNCTITHTVDIFDVYRFLYTPEASTLVVQSGIEECIECADLYQQIVAYNKERCSSDILD